MGRMSFTAISTTRATSNHGHELYLTDNGVVLSYESIAPMYLTLHYRPPHAKDPGGLRHEREQNAAGVGSSHEEGTSTASASASGSSPQGEAPGSSTDPKARPAPKKRPKTAQTADASPDTGSSPQGEVPTLDAEERGPRAAPSHHSLRGVNSICVSAR